MKKKKLRLTQCKNNSSFVLSQKDKQNYNQTTLLPKKREMF